MPDPEGTPPAGRPRPPGQIISRALLVIGLALLLFVVVVIGRALG